MEQQSYDKKYGLDNKNRKYTIKSSVLLEHEWTERKVKIQCEREDKENQSNNAIKQRNKMKKTKQKEEKKNTNEIKEVKIMKKQ